MSANNNNCTTPWHTMTEVRCKLHNAFLQYNSICTAFMDALNNNVFTDIKFRVDGYDPDKNIFKCAITLGSLQNGNYDISMRNAETVTYVDILNAVAANLQHMLSILAMTPDQDPDIVSAYEFISNVEHRSSIAMLCDIIIYDGYCTICI